MSDSIVSTKKIPIATRDFCSIDKSLVEDLYCGFGFLPHNNFFCALFDDKDDNWESKSFPLNCVTVHDFVWETNALANHDRIGIVNENEIPGLSEWKSEQGVYFCIRCLPSGEQGWDFHNEIIYVGKTNNICQRFSSHHKKKAFEFLGFDRLIFISYKVDLYSESDVLWAERQYIEMLKPILNDRHCLGLLSSDETESKTNAIHEVSTIWDMAYNEGLKHGFASAKNQMMDFFDSAIQPPKLK